MEVQSIACKSINSDKLIFNYAIRKRSPMEYRRLQLLITQRKIELKQKLKRMEEKMAEVIDEAEYTSAFENYMMNRISGKPEFSDDNSIAEAARIFVEERERRIKAKNDKNNAQNLN